MADVAGFVAAGGRSSRMGDDKAWLELGGRPMIEHVIAALQPVTTSVAILANDRKYDRLGLPVLPDSQMGVGPLEAIRTALSSSSSERIVLVACDLPFVTSDLFRFLITVGSDYDVIVPISAEEKLEPLCAIYRKRALAAVEALILSGERKISFLFDRVTTRRVRFDELRHLPDAESFFININTPEEYARALSMINSRLGAKNGHTEPSK